MSKSSSHNAFLPPQAQQALQALGEHLALARKRRKQSLREWAMRMGVSVRTVQRMEQGDVPLEDGLLMLFPSYLLHSGLPYRGGQDRVLIAFNAHVHIREGSPSATRFRGAH